ncbi:MAG: hypothetical protein PF637_05035 [Spirochaetes bacterium]|nr:hypothetical protein [Spirochaetota bacterium]
MNLKEKVLIRKYLERKDYPAVLEQTAGILKKEQNSYLFFLHAKSLYNLQKYSESLESIKKALRYKDVDAELFLLAGRIYLKLDYFKKAEEFYRHVIKVKPENAEASASYAFLLYITGNNTESEEFLSRAFIIEENNLFALVTHFKIGLYNRGFKKEAFRLEEIITHCTAESFYTTHEILTGLYTGQKRKAKKLLKQKASKLLNDELYKALKKTISLGKNKKIRTASKKITAITISLNTLILSSLFFLNRDLFILWLFLCALMVIAKIVSIIRKVYYAFRENR